MLLVCTQLLLRAWGQAVDSHAPGVQAPRTDLTHGVVDVADAHVAATGQLVGREVSAWVFAEDLDHPVGYPTVPWDGHPCALHCCTAWARLATATCFLRSR